MSGDEYISGKTIAINVDQDMFDINGNIDIKYDGENVKIADDIYDILNPNDDGSHSEYLITIGAEGIKLLISIPHFSEHTITISSVAEVVDALGGPAAVILYITVFAIVAIIYIAPIIFVEKKK